MGVNPVSGGRPARDRRMKGVSAIRMGEVVHESARALILWASKALNMRKAEEVIRM